MPDSREPIHREAKLDELPVANPLDVQPTYTNNASIFMTQWDIRFIFTEIVVGINASVSNEMRANVVMTPKHAKAFLDILAQNIALYEKDHGKL